jgi:hypothetical protein
VARVRPGKVRVLGRLVIEDFASRPAAEWGGEYTRFLKSLSAERFSATVLLPRREVIVRQVALPGVASKDLESAIRFQLESMHPYGEDEVVWGSSPLAFGSVLVGIARKEAIDRYATMFLEAGVPVASFTFSAAAMHAAIRLNSAPAPAGGFVALSRTAAGAVEVYGESPSRPVFTAEFDLPPARAAALALSELRLTPGSQPYALEDLLPKPLVNPIANDLSRNARPYATALAGACPHLAPAANVLPPGQRRSNSRTVFVPTAILGALVLMVVGAMAAYSSWSERDYLHKLNQQIAALEPARKKADALDRQYEQLRARAVLLDQFHRQTRADLDALNELTHLIEPPAWTRLIELNRDNARLGGDAPQTAPLPKILDSSPYFEGTEIMTTSRGPNGETFQLRTNRRKSR